MHNKKNVDSFLSKEYSNWSGLTITNSAAKQIRKLTKKNPEMQGLKINVKKSGCAGFTYSMQIVTSSNSDHSTLIYEQYGVKLFVPLEIISLIDGTELDYVQEGLNYMFKFNNPTAQYFCGCGESFGVKKNI